MSLIPRNIRRDILSTWARVPELDAEGIRWYPSSVPRSDVAEAIGWSPTVDLSEADGEFVLTAELPGVKADDIEIDVGDGILSLKGVKEEERREKTKDFRLYEREYGSFERRFNLPRSANPEEASATFENGVLTVHLPKHQKALGKRIRVESNG